MHIPELHLCRVTTIFYAQYVLRHEMNHGRVDDRSNDHYQRCFEDGLAFYQRQGG
jgi:hypothetical protein